LTAETTDQGAADLIAGLDLILNQEKCIKQFVTNVRKNAKFRSNQLKARKCIVENVSLEEIQDSDWL